MNNGQFDNSQEASLFKDFSENPGSIYRELAQSAQTEEDHNYVEAVFNREVVGVLMDEAEKENRGETIDRSSTGTMAQVLVNIGRRPPESDVAVGDKESPSTSIANE